jgi:hypothetical protein
MSLVQWQLLPVFIHVALIGFLGARMGSGRVAAARSGETRINDVALDSSRWPEPLRKLGNNFDNQFQLPMMWYAAIAFVLVTGLADAVTVVLSWIFIASRIAHTLIHTESNVVVRRFQAFLVGLFSLLAIWVWFGIRLFVTG